MSNKLIILGNMINAGSPFGIAEMVFRSLIFLSLLALGGYFFVIFHRRGYFSTISQKSKKDDLNIVCMRMLGNKKSLTIVEHRGKRFLLALTADKIEKISEWDLLTDNYESTSNEI